MDLNKPLSIAEYRALQSNGYKNKKLASRRKHKTNVSTQETVDLFPKLVLSETGLTCVKEYEFHPSRKWRFDYAIVEIKMAIEVEGGVFKTRTYQNKKGQTIITTGGRHNSATGYLNDIEKYNAAALAGWTLYRVTPQTLTKSPTFEAIKSMQK